MYGLSPPYWGYLEKVLDSDWSDQVHKYSWTTNTLCPFFFSKSPWHFWCGVFAPDWRSRHTGWGHIGQEGLEDQADHEGQGFLALPEPQLVLGYHLYRNQAYQLDLWWEKQHLEALSWVKPAY